MTDSPFKGMTAVLYARVSTNDKGQTNETQKHLMKEWCERNEVNIDGIYEDEMTGTTLQRPGFSQMILRILTPPYNINILLAYDASRLTRDKKLDEIQSIIKPAGCVVRLVNNDIDPDSFEGDLVNAVTQRIDKRENDVRKAKTKMRMDELKRDHKHVGRPAAFMFTEDIESAPEGRFRKGKTKTGTEEYILSFAKQGLSINYVATHILGVDPNSLVHEMRMANPDDPKCRDKGIVDRWTPYMTLYREARKTGKGSDGERVENPSENDGERVIV